MVKYKNKAQERMLSKSFNMMFNTIWIFGIPAFLAFVIGDRIDSQNDWDVPYGKLGLLALAFIISWLLIFKQVNSLKKEWKEEIIEDEN